MPSFPWQSVGMTEAFQRIRARQELRLAAALSRADRPMAIGWWALLLVRGLLPAGFSIATGVLVGAVQRGDCLALPLAVVGVVFVLLQVSRRCTRRSSANLGDRTAAWLYDELTEACARRPGIGHLEDPELADGPQVATGLRPRHDRAAAVHLDGLHRRRPRRAGRRPRLRRACCSASPGGRRWCSPARGWRPTGCCARARSGGTATPTRSAQAQRDADYAYRLAVDPPAAKELRIFGLPDWVLERFIASRHAAAPAAVRGDADARALGARQPRARAWPPTSLVSWTLAVGGARPTGSASAGWSPTLRRPSARRMIAFGGLNWALDGAAAPVAAVARLKAAMARPARCDPGDAAGRRACRAHEIRFRDVTLRLPGRAVAPGARRLRPHHPGGQSLAIVGQNGAGKTTLAKLLCRLYDPQSGAIEVDGIDLRDLDLESWRGRVTAVFQDFVRFELSLRENVAPREAAAIAGRRRSRARRHRRRRCRGGADGLADLDTVLAKGYAGGIDLSGGQWQRVALARALSRGPARRRARAARRADRPARRPRARRRSSSGCSRPPGRARRSSSRTGSRRCATPTGSASSSDGARRRARQPRRADGAARPLPDDVRRCRPQRFADRTRRGRRGRGDLRCPLLRAAPGRRPTPDPTTPAAARCRSHVAAVQARLPATSRALMGVAFVLALRRGAARRAARALARAARRGAARARATACCGSPSWRSPSRRCATWLLQTVSTTAAAALPRQGHDRARVARGPAPGDDRDRSRTRSGRSTSTGCRCCASRSSRSTTCTCRCSRPRAGSCGSASPWCCWRPSTRCLILLVLFALPDGRGHLAGGPVVERTAQERGAQADRLAAAPVRAVDHRVAGQGAAGPRHRRAARRAPPGVVGAAGTRPVARRAGRARLPGTRPAGRSSRSATSARSCSSPPGRSASPAVGHPGARPPVPGCPPTSARRSARSASCAASGWTDRGGWPGSRTTPARRRSTPTCRRRTGIAARASGSSTSRSAIRARTEPALARRRPVPAGRRGGRDRRRERRRQVHAGQAARQAVHARPRAAS